MTSTDNKNRIIYLIIMILLLGLFMFKLSSFIPPMADDYYFSGNIEQLHSGEYVFSLMPFESFHDVFKTASRIGYLRDLRTGNLIFPFLYYCGGMKFLSVVISALFLSLICLISKLFFGRLSTWKISFVTLAFFVVIPVWKRVYMWHDAALVYLIPSIFVTVFFYLLKKECEIPSLKYALATVACAMLCAWGHEGIGVPLAAGLSLWILCSYMRNRKLPYGTLCICVLTLILVLACVLLGCSMQSRIENNTGLSVRGYLINAVFFLYHCHIAILIWLIAVYRLRHKLLDSPYFFVSLACAGIPILTSSGGWGGVYFFFCFMSLCLAMEASIPLLEKRECKIGIVSLPFVLAILLYFYHYTRQFNDICQSIFEKGKTEQVVAINFFEDDVDYNWMLNSFLPLVGKDDYRSAMLAREYGTGEFSVALNQIVKDDTVYELFSNTQLNEPLWLKTDEVSIIAFPKNMLPISGNKNTGFKGNLKYECWEKLYNIYSPSLRKFVKPHSVYTSVTYHNNNFYYVMEKEANNFDTLEITVKDKQWGNEKRTIKLQPSGDLRKHDR